MSAYQRKVKAQAIIVLQAVVSRCLWPNKQWKNVFVDNNFRRLLVAMENTVTVKKEKLGTKRKESPSIVNREGTAEAKDDEKEEGEEEIAIAELAQKRMKLEVEVKKKEMKNLKHEKEAAAKKVAKLSSELETALELVEKELESATKHEMEEKACRENVESIDIQIKELQKRREINLKLVFEKQALVRYSEAAISLKCEEGNVLTKRYEEAKLELEKVEEDIVKLPSALGYSQETLHLLDLQIAAKRDELEECPVCFEECSPPIYTCEAQHPVCASCR